MSQFGPYDWGTGTGNIDWGTLTNHTPEPVYDPKDWLEKIQAREKLLADHAAQAIDRAGKAHTEAKRLKQENDELRRTLKAFSRALVAILQRTRHEEHCPAASKPLDACVCGLDGIAEELAKWRAGEVLESMAAATTESSAGMSVLTSTKKNGLEDLKKWLATTTK